MRPPVRALCLLCLGIVADGCAKTQAPSRPSPPRAAQGADSRDTIQATIKNDCPRTVNVAFGTQPPGEDADLTRLPPGSVQTRKLGPNERLWLVREDGTWAAGASVAGDGGQITILATCSAIGTTEAV
jgi:hypothetical protein